MVIEDTKQLVEAVRSAARHGLITSNDVSDIMYDFVWNRKENGFLVRRLQTLTYEWLEEDQNLRIRR